MELFGGKSSAGVLNDTWKWTGTTWTQVTKSGNGDRAEFDLDRIGLSDQTTLYVNRGLGDIGVRTTDITLAGVGGPLTINRWYLRVGGNMNKTLPVKWVFDTGADLRLGDLPDGDKLLFNEGGSLLWFNKNGAVFVTPPGIDATLRTVTGALELTYNASGRKLRFVNNQLISDSDRDGNAVTFAYDGSGKTSR